jgi:hypothetical protein
VAVHREICENFMAKTFKDYFGTSPMYWPYVYMLSGEDSNSRNEVVINTWMCSNGGRRKVSAVFLQGVGIVIYGFDFVFYNLLL